jgi:aspartate aminotransferase
LITNVPQGAFYVFPDAKSLYGKTDGTTVINNSEDLCNYILQKVHVALVPGSAFGDPNCIRISYAASKPSLVDAMHRIKNAISDLY